MGLITEDNKRIEAHKAILSACSPLLKNILDQASTIFLSEVKSAEFESVLKFMYIGEGVVENKEVAVFLELSSKLQMNDLIVNNQKTKFEEKEKENSETNKCKKIENLITTNIEQSSISSGESELVTTDTKVDNAESEKQYFCDHCDYFAEIVEELESHKLSMHLNLSKDKKGELYSCWECGKEL